MSQLAPVPIRSHVVLYSKVIQFFFISPIHPRAPVQPPYPCENPHPYLPKPAPVGAGAGFGGYGCGLVQVDPRVTHEDH